MKIKFNNLLIVALCGVLVVSCQKQDTNQLDKDKTVDVALSIGFDDEADAYDLMQSTRGGEIDGDAGFDFNLVPSAKTRANSAVPDKLYNLEVRQYDANGSYLGGQLFTSAQTIGSKLSISLIEKNNCQLVIVAWGDNADVSATSLGAKSLGDAMDVMFPSSLIANIQTTTADMKGMPYVMHLKNINVAANGIIQSGNGEIDARIRLKRLAALLTINWDYNVAGYDLKQVFLQGIPTNFRVVPNPDKTNNTYPSLLDQFKVEQLTTAQIAKKSYSLWIPANVRGNSATANSTANRYKATAPQGSTFINFVSVNIVDSKKKLDYRVYLGGTNVTNFDVLGNTNYNYDVNFSHTGIPVNDKRVKYIDPIPASQNNNTFVQTANCFMVAPGGSFNFNPYVYQVNGSSVAHSHIGNGKWGDIASVKLLWQTKESGDIGDPVIGIVNSDKDHVNIVEYNKDTKRIYCRVAPNTSGGSGVIAAYDAAGVIIWSWHVWVTDYNPDPTGNTSVDTPSTKRKQKYTNGGAVQLPMMDRNLGAVAGYTIVPPTELEKSKTNGFHYQWGRKDPFPSSFTEKVLAKITFNTEGKPTPGMLNYYKPDGYSYYHVDIKSEIKSVVRDVYKTPSVFYNLISSSVKNWCTDPDKTTFWGNNAVKGVHDPCPAGWRIPKSDEFKPFLTNTNLNAINTTSSMQDGGGVVFFESNYASTRRTTYIRATGYTLNSLEFTGIGTTLNYWPRDNDTSSATSFSFRMNVGVGTLTGAISSTWHHGDGHPVRCIQEK